MYHYTYKLTLPSTKEYYFGSRSCKVHPLLDKYMGSMITWKPDKTQLKKEILRFDFNNREECIEHERNLIIEHKDNLLNKNANIPGIGFHTVGVGVYIDNNGKAYRAHKNDELVKNGTLKPFWQGRTHTAESKRKMHDAAIGREDSLETKLKKSKSLTGLKKSKEHRKNISKAQCGKNNNMYGRTGDKHPRSKTIIQFDLQMNFIKEWSNASLAAKELNISYAALNNCCRNNKGTSAGYIWKYK
jgi:hypothetical protein